MNKVLKVLSLSFLLCLSLVVAPFHIHANGSLPAPFVGYNIYDYDYDTDTYITNYNVDLDSSGFTMTCTNMLSSGGCNTYKQTSNEDITGTISLKGSTGVHTNRILKIELILDNNYVGYVNLTHSGIAKNYYVNGNKIEIFTTNTSQTISINSYELNINTSNNTTWMFPIESYSINQYLLKTYSSKIIGFNNVSNYFYPIFDLKKNDVVYRLWNSVPSYVVFWTDKNINNINTLNQYLSLSNGQFTEYQNLYTTSYGGLYGHMLRVKIENNGTAGVCDIKLLQDMQFIGVYYGYAHDKYISTEFALQFGLKNELLDNIDKIANGTSSSESSQSDLSQKTDDLNTSSNQLLTQEDNFNNDMNSALQNIDTNFNVGTNFGSKFIASADWVKTQYDRLTGNTPFGSVISFSLLIGLALLLVGKVFK